MRIKLELSVRMNADGKGFMRTFHRYLKDSSVVLPIESYIWIGELAYKITHVGWYDKYDTLVYTLFETIWAHHMEFDNPSKLADAEYHKNQFERHCQHLIEDGWILGCSFEDDEKINEEKT